MSLSVATAKKRVAKYFIKCKKDEKITPLLVKVPQMSGYCNKFKKRVDVLHNQGHKMAQ